MNKLVPKLRFPTPLVKYKRFRFGDLVSIKSNKFNPAIESFVYPCIELEHISQGTGILLGSVASDTVASQKNKFGAGDILFSKLRPYLKKYAMPTFTGICSSEIWVMKTNSLLEHSYLYQYIQTDKFIYEANKSSGSKMPRSDWGVVSELSFYCPSKLEQEKIADFLASVDTKISQLTEKHRLLKDYKKGVMQQIFSQKIHFKDDDGNAFPEWNTHELAMLSESGISNGVFNDPKKVGKGFRLINVKDMYKGDSIEYSELTLLDLEPKLFEKNKVKYGDIFFTRSSIVPTGIAFSNVNLSEKEDITFDGHLMKISPNKKLVDPLFLAYYLRSYTPRKTLVSRGKQSTMTTIAQDDIKDIKLNIPALKEQQKIAQFLQSIDKKTSAVNEQIEQTKLFKKGLLQQMFV